MYIETILFIAIIIVFYFLAKYIAEVSNMVSGQRRKHHEDKFKDE